MVCVCVCPVGPVACVLRSRRPDSGGGPRLIFVFFFFFCYFGLGELKSITCRSIHWTAVAVVDLVCAYTHCVYISDAAAQRKRDRLLFCPLNAFDTCNKYALLLLHSHRSRLIYAEDDDDDGNGEEEDKIWIQFIFTCVTHIARYSYIVWRCHSWWPRHMNWNWIQNQAASSTLRTHFV